MTEQEYLKQYNIENYERPSIATDIVVFSIMQEENSNNRKLPDEKLKVLLIKRASHPCMDMWALPGGFCRKNEDIVETARRELKEETGVENAYLSIVGIEGEVGRDKRGWIISHSFMALIDGRKYEVRGGTDAWEAKWFEVSLNIEEKKKEVSLEHAYVETQYILKLTNKDEVFGASILEKKQFAGFHENISYTIEENQGLAFDHAKIITKAILSLRKKVDEDGKLAFDLLPEYFTLTQLQKVCETILDKELTRPNFRRKMADLVVETDEMYEDSWTRPAKLFKRNLQKFYN